MFCCCVSASMYLLQGCKCPHVFLVVCMCVCEYLECLCVTMCVHMRVCVCSCLEQPPQYNTLSAPGFPSEDLKEAHFCQELQPLTVCRLHLAEHTLRTYTQKKPIRFGQL